MHKQAGHNPAGPGPDLRHWYFLGCGLTLWGCWQLSTALGIAFGARIPPEWDIDFAVPLTFIALLTLRRGRVLAEHVAQKPRPHHARHVAAHAVALEAARGAALAQHFEVDATVRLRIGERVADRGDDVAALAERA